MTTESNRSRETILVVDDNRTNLKVLLDLLDNNGYDVVYAENGEIALKRAALLKPDLILLDIVMPILDGFETCGRLKEHSDIREIPVIFMSALSETVDKVRGFDLGAVDYITKPIQHEEVLSRIRTHLMIRDLTRKLEEKTVELLRFNHDLEEVVKEKTRRLINQEKSAVIGRLLQGMVHNFKNPLNTILGFNDLIAIETQSRNLDTVQSYCEKITFAGQHMQQMMDNLLVRSRNDQTQNLQAVNINTLLKNEIELLNADLIFRDRIEKDIVLDPEIPEIPMIFSDMSQVIHNLIDNAVDAMHNVRNASLLIRTRTDSQQIYVDVCDNGCGIAEEHMEKIFDPFYSSKRPRDSNGSATPSGTGLGLHTCCELLKPYGGLISVVSTPGNGSTFTIALPKPTR